MVDSLQVNSSRWAPSIDRSVKLNTWLCFLADSREIEEQVEPSHPPPLPRHRLQTESCPLQE